MLDLTADAARSGFEMTSHFRFEQRTPSSVVAYLVLVRYMRLYRFMLTVAAALMTTAPVIGSPIVSGREVARFIVSAPKPEYPIAARATHITGSGTFILHIQVRTGLVRFVDVENSTGSALLDSAAVAALKKWRFKPGVIPTIAKLHLHRSDPYPIEDSVARVPINFTMR